VLTALLVATGCGDGDAAAGDQAQFCQATEDLQELDEEVTRAAAGAFDDAEGGDDSLDEMLEVLERRRPAVESAYRSLAESAPDELRGEVAILRDFTLEVFGELARTGSIEEVSRVYADRRDESERAGAAAQAVDAHSREVCGSGLR
jgi:hypothetical protein